MKLSEGQAWMRGTEEEVNFIIKTFDLPKNAEILDLGCGIGRPARKLAAPGYKVTCV